ncbi:Ig-like domain-containing protein, partial [Patescibacteria group bacterium]|nr:Ig-like domain-containing protein [Patescibacteria group bacterium]
MEDFQKPLSSNSSESLTTKLNPPANRKKVVGIILSLLGLGIVGFYIWQDLPSREVRPFYTQTYRLVPEKISQSAAIQISLPPGADEVNARGDITFDPELKGDWLAVPDPGMSWIPFARAAETATETNGAKILFFQPKEKLKLNRYYTVELKMPDGGVVKGDFLAVEDPEIIAVFPKEGSEAPEDSEITIVFNRPMVPLTTLSELEKKDVPIEITPATEGRFKWITTRNLQFIPTERLIRSSHYKVKIKDGFVSMEGLALEGSELEFVTRRLRNVAMTRGTIIYNQPISVEFNQPVDLERTKNEITLINNITGQKVPFIAEYRKESSVSGGQSNIFSFAVRNMSSMLANVGSRLGLSLFPAEEVKKDKEMSVIQIYNAKDRFGRKKLWDFEQSYTVTINQAYPAEGDINVDSSLRASVSVTSIIKDITAESDRTSYAAKDFFDPKGKIWIEFYEDIDLKRSDISVPKSTAIDYGEKCKDETLQLSIGVLCEKTEDKKRVFVLFESQKIGLGERIKIQFEKVRNTEGFQINKEPFERSITSYPEFQILRTLPGNGTKGAALTEFTFCSNTPIRVPQREEFGQYLKTNLAYEIQYWGASRRIEYIYTGAKCRVGEFQTRIDYGLMPLEDYSLEFQLVDVFDQEKDYSLEIATGPMPSDQLNLFHMQRRYSVSSPARTKLTYAARNMEFVDVEICKLSAYSFLFQLENQPQAYEPPSVVTNCQEIVKDTIVLPNRFWLKNFFTVNISEYFADPLGQYIVTLTHPNYIRNFWKRGGSFRSRAYERTFLDITNLAVAEKRIKPQVANFGANEPLSAQQLDQLQNLYWVSNLGTLEPVAGATILFYQGDNLVFAGSDFTDEKGVALTKVLPNIRGVIISFGDDSTVIPNTQSRVNYGRSASAAEKIYLYTDKPIYQPGQEVFIKGIHRIGYDGNYEIFQDRPVNLKVSNSKNDEISSEDLQINDFGTFDTKFILEKDSPLGAYRICVEQYSCISFDVQQFVPAAFEVTVSADKEEYISKDIINLDVQADYFFGAPVEAGKVSYTVSSQNYYFDRYSGRYFSFGQRRYYYSPFPYGDKFLLRGETTLVDGQAVISLPMDFAEFFANDEEKQSKLIIFDITVQNPQGQSVSIQRSSIVHAGELYLGVKAEKSFVSKNEEVAVRVKSVDIKGKEVVAGDVAMDVYTVKWIYAKRQGVGGGYSYIWEKQRDLVEQYMFSTDKNGDHTETLRLAKEGQYEIEVWTTDGRGNPIRSISNLYVYGKGAVSIQPSTGTKLELEAESTSLNVGEKGEIIIKSPYAKAKALITIERGKIFDYEIKDIQGNLANYTFIVEEQHVPNVFVSVLLQSADPEVKFGQLEFQVNTGRKELDIQVDSNKTHYLPGEEVTLDITATDYTGRPVEAEVSIAVVDLSVLALKGNPKRNPVVFFYGGFPLTVTTSSNLRNILVETEISSKGGGGLAAAEDLARKARGEFREVAFWRAVTRTDQQGKAQITFTLPDNLTRWQAESIGITKDTRLGVDYSEFTTRKDLMLIPLRPRFVVPGDVFLIGAKIFNQTSERQNLEVTFKSQTLVLQEESAVKKIGLADDQTQTVYFKVQASQHIEEGVHNFVLSVHNDAYEDTVLQDIPITPNTTYETTATANFTSDEVTREYIFLPGNIVKEKGGLSVQSSATLAVFLSDALNYLIQYPYGCSEQISSRLNAIAIVKHGLNLPNVGDKFQLEKILYQGKEYT